MSKSYLEYVSEAIEAYKNKDAKTLAACKQLAFTARRYQKQNSQSTDTVLNLYPILGIHQLTELTCKYEVTSIEQFYQAVQSYQLTDVIATNALWQWRAAKQRILRTSTTNIVEHIKRTLARVGIKTTVVGEFSRHKDTIANLEFCIEVGSQDEILLAKATLQQELLAETKITDIGLSIDLKTDIFDINCFLYFGTHQNFCTCSIYHIGPKCFIDKLNHKLVSRGYELTSTGLQTLEGLQVPCRSEKTIWDIVGSTIPPTSARDSIDDIMYDTTNLVTYKTSTGDTGITYRAKDSAKIKHCLENKSLTHVALIIQENSLDAVTQAIDQIHILVKDSAIPVYTGLLVTSNTLEHLSLAAKVDFLIIEDDEINALYKITLPKARKVAKNIIIRNPFMFSQGMCLTNSSFPKDEILTILNKNKIAIEITGNCNYAGTPVDAWKDVIQTRCAITIGSAQYAKQQTQSIVSARIKCCQALISQQRLMDAAAFEEWLR